MTENGILARIPRQYVADALQTLPAPNSASEELMETEIDVPDIGRAHFNAKLHTSKQGRFRSYFWSVKCATLVE